VFGEGGETKVYAAQPERRHAAKALGDFGLFLKDCCGCLRRLHFFLLEAGVTNRVLCLRAGFLGSEVWQNNLEKNLA
jgi:hypothetical protein